MSKNPVTNPLGAATARKGGGGGWFKNFAAEIFDAANTPKQTEAAEADAPVKMKQFETREPTNAFRQAVEEKAALLGETRSKSAARKRLLGE